MIAGIYNMLCEQGADFTRSVVLKYPDIVNDPTGATYLPFNLSNYTARMQVRRNVEASTVDIELTTANSGIALETNQTGEIVLTMTNSQTAALTDSGVYDLEIISNTGIVSRVIQGTFTLDLEVTH